MARKRKPLWKGPLEDGLTQSLLQRWLCCRERFRLKAVEGLSEDEGFRHGLEFGNLWHEAEEKFCGGKDWKKVIKSYYQKLRAKYQTDEKDVTKWYRICLLQFPIYIDYWKQKESVAIQKRKYLLQEVSFKVPYKLPSGRFILLRGKWDAVYKIGNEIYLQENKTKGKIDAKGITQTLPQNLQTMFYLIALKAFARRARKDDLQAVKIKGVMYNVIRRPLSQNAKHNIRPRKAETDNQFYKRLAKEIRDDPSYFFMRWTAPIRKDDYEKFKREIFHPILESFLDWWESINCGYTNPFEPWSSPLHYRTPFGVYNSLWDGYRGDYFEYLTTGDDSDLIKISTLYPELDV